MNLWQRAERKQACMEVRVTRVKLFAPYRPPGRQLPDVELTLSSSQGGLLAARIYLPGASRGQAQTDGFVSELLPRVSQCIDELCVLRSLHTDNPNHGPALFLINNGTITAWSLSIDSRNPGTRCAPSRIMSVPSAIARSINACPPTATAACGRSLTPTSSRRCRRSTSSSKVTTSEKFAAPSVDLRARRADLAVLGVVHEADALRHAVRDHRARDDDAVAVVRLDPVDQRNEGVEAVRAVAAAAVDPAPSHRQRVVRQRRQPRVHVRHAGDAEALAGFVQAGGRLVVSVGDDETWILDLMPSAPRWMPSGPESVQTLVETKVLVGDRGAYRMPRVPEVARLPMRWQTFWHYR